MVIPRTERGTACGTQRPVRIEELDTRTRERCQRLPEQRRKEQVRLTGAYHVGRESQSAHDIYAVTERAGYTLLRRTHDMRRRMAVKVEADNLRTRSPVTQHTFGTVAEGQHHNAVRTNGGRGGKVVHGGIIERLLHHIAAYPRIHYARTVDAEQDAVARPSGRMVHMHERIDTRLRVGLRRIDNTVHHAARTSRRGHLARLQNIQREGVVWLVTRTIRYRGTFRYAEQLLRCGIGLGLRTDRRPGLGDHLMRNAVPVGHEVGTTLLGKVPQYLLRQAAHARREVSRQPIGYIVSGQHKLVDVREQLGFVALDPRQLRGREVSGRVERRAKTVVAAYAFESLRSPRHASRTR